MIRPKVVYGICAAIAVLLLILLCVSSLPWPHRVFLIAIWLLGLLYGVVSWEREPASNPPEPPPAKNIVGVGQDPPDDKRAIIIVKKRWNDDDLYGGGDVDRH
jgi:hypothetical protein